MKIDTHKQTYFYKIFNYEYTIELRKLTDDGFPFGSVSSSGINKIGIKTTGKSMRRKYSQLTNKVLSLEFIFQMCK